MQAALLLAGPVIDQNEPDAVLSAGSRLPSFHYLGEIAPAEVRALMSAADVFLNTSLHEGMPGAVLEAMAAGIPVIATNVNGIKEVVIDGKCGILVPPRNPEAIANAILRIINDPQLCKDLVQEGFERARLFDIQEHIFRLDNLYNSLLGVESYQL